MQVTGDDMLAFERKLVDLEHLSSCVAQLARPLVFTNGVFDILHRGHATYLSRARSLGASMIVAVNSDSSVRQLEKGSDRPFNQEAERAALVAALQSVDLVVIFASKVPLDVLEIVRPEIYVKGGDYDMQTILEAQWVARNGGVALAIPFEHDRSTTGLISRIRATS